MITTVSFIMRDDQLLTRLANENTSAALAFLVVMIIVFQFIVSNLFVALVLHSLWDCQAQIESEAQFKKPTTFATLLAERHITIRIKERILKLKTKTCCRHLFRTKLAKPELVIIEDKVESSISSSSFSSQSLSQNSGDKSVNSSDFSEQSARSETLESEADQEKAQATFKTQFEKHQEELETLQLLNWQKQFSYHDLDSDLVLVDSLTSADQEQTMLRERDKRCGFVIWSSVLQLSYFAIYMALQYTRYPSSLLLGYNEDVARIVSLHEVVFEDQNNHTVLYPYQDLQSREMVFKWVSTFGEDYITETMVVPYKTLVNWNVPLSFLQTPRNYIIDQNFVLCFQLFTTAKITTDYRGPVS